MASDEYARQGSERSGYWLASKVELAKAAANIVRATGEFPPELVALLGHVEAIARASGIELVQPQVPAGAAAGLTGKALVSLMSGTFMDLWVLDFDRRVFEPFGGGGKQLSYASWSADGSMIAGTGRIFRDRRNAILILNADGSERNWVSTRTSKGAEDNPCWFPDGRRVLFRTGEGTTCCASHDGEQWRTVYSLATAHHCVSLKGRIARTVYRNDKYHVEIGGKDGNEPYEAVPGTTDVRGAVSWSRTGRYLAIANLIESGRGAVCIHDYGARERTTTFLTSHNGKPRSVCFSPDERHVLYTWRDRQGHWLVCAVNVETREISIVVPGRLPEPIIGCHAWRQ